MVPNTVATEIYGERVNSLISSVGILKILIADKDEKFAHSFLKRFQEINNLDVSTDFCHSGIHMLEKVFSNPYDLIFMTMDFPDIDGLEILSRLTQTSLPFPFVMLAQRNDARLIVKVMKRGVLDVIMKEDILSLDLNRVIQRLVETSRLRRENAELQQINKMKNDFLATISHELRTPLTSILGLSEILVSGKMGDIPPNQKKSISKILQQSHNLVRLINQLLDIRALTEEKMKLELGPISLKEIISKQLETVRPVFEKKSVKLQYKQSTQDFNVMAHMRSLSKVFEHLISNSLKFSSKGGRVKVEIFLKNKKHVEVKISDTGKGIPKESLAYVFQKFFHADQSLTRPYGGMGLGLAYCKEVIVAHKGRIWVESHGAEKGTTVSFTLPVSVDSPEVIPSSNGEKRILWVDDNPTMLELVEYGFASFPETIQLTTAEGGVSALSQIKIVKPDLIVLDIMMPDMDGIEVLNRIKKDKNTKKTPILIVSGYPKAARKAVELGASDYCLKPFRMNDVLEKIQKLLFSKR